MATTKDIIAGMQILLPYYTNPDGYNCAAEHDTFYMAATDMPVSEEDRAKLATLCWYQEGEEYSINESWYIFT